MKHLRIRDKVRVVAAVDQYIHDVSVFIGRPGIVADVGGQHMQGMIIVEFPGPFPGGKREAFWPEELALL